MTWFHLLSLAIIIFAMVVTGVIAGFFILLWLFTGGER